MKVGIKGAIVASAVAAMFVSSFALAQNSSSASSASVKCVGANDCKGKSSCKTAQNDCKGQNACKGKGYVMTSTPDECKAKGGTPKS